MKNLNNAFPEMLNGGGKTGELIRSFNWENTSLGPIEEWPSNLSTTVSIIINSRIPMFLFWGKTHILLYNDAYIPALAKLNWHPGAMGQNGQDVWANTWKFIKPQIDLVEQGHNDSHINETKLLFQKTLADDIHLTYHLSPVKNADGSIAGTLVICNETLTVAARKQLQAQKELELLNKEITHLFNSINEGFYSKDVIKNEYLNLSSGCPKIYGYTIAEFFANPMLWAEVIHPEDKQRVFNDDMVLKKGQSTLTEYRIFHKEGSIRWIEVKAVPILVNGILTRIDGIVTDITVRKQAELEIKKQKELSESIINTLPGIFYLYDIDGRFIKWNKNFEIVSGYSTEEIKQLHPLDLFDQDEKELLKEAIGEVFCNGKAEIKANFFTKDGKKIPHYFNGKAIVYKGKNCLVGMGIDITEHVKTQEALQKNEKMLSYILNAIPQAIFWKDAEKRYTGCNKVFAKAAGFSNPDLLIGKTDLDCPWKPEEAQKYQADDEEVMRLNQPKAHIIETQKQADGKAVWVDTTKIPLTDENDVVYGVLGIYDDITERKLAEEEREKLTADLIERNINLKQFSYIVSHNLRSPINRILGLASLFHQETDRVDPNLRLIRYIVNEATNLDNVVKDLTTIVSYQDLGTTIKEEIIFDHELKLIKNNLDSEITKSKAIITTAFEKPDRLLSVRGYFYSILYNLLSNALKYKSSKRQLKIHLETTEDDKYVYLSVSDNGLGIDLNKHGEALFTLYKRFHSDQIPGKGMGLNLVKTQAETLGGKVEVNSTPDAGTTFKVSFLKD